MEKVNESLSSSNSDHTGFFKYVFNFDEENKNTMMNMVQYTLLAIIPVLIILKSTKYIFPEEDDSKGSLELVAESVGQIVLIILMIWFTNKIIHYIPTYSGEKYHKFNELNFIIPFLIILATMQTKLGAKLNILMDRVMGLWEGGRAAPAEQAQGNGIRVSQPFAGQQRPAAAMHQPSQADYLDRNQLLPMNAQMSSMPTMQQAPQQQQQQQKPDFNQMYQNQATGMPGAGFPMDNEPMAANGALGGMFGGSAW